MFMQILLQLLELISGLCAAGAALGCVYLLAAIAAVLRVPRQSRAHDIAALQPLTVLKPLRGAEPGLMQRLVAVCRQDYAGPVQIVCGVQDGADPAIATVEELAAREPAVELVIDSRRRGSNPKMSNLANMLPRARHDLLVMADSDIEIDPDYLGNLAAELQKPGVGAVTCLYRGVPAGGVWAELSALAVNGHFLPNAVLALALRLAQPCFGTTIAMQRSTLDRIGGFDAFNDVLAEDYEIGKAVRALGYEVVIPSFTIGHVCYEESFGRLMTHDLRVARTIKSIDPIGYWGAALTHPFPLAILGVFSGGVGAAMLAVLALACRGVLCLCVERRFGVPRQPYWLLPVRDVLSFAVYAWGLAGSVVNWRGSTFRVSLNGRLTPDRESA